MASIIEGYNYDIFISYRQKDNKYDGWVTEFVDNLKKELEATFKEEISVYFDVNPHDGLLETHDVDASIKDKLKCLIFIPIISRTYCDPKSFAWEHEFKAFVEQASNDQFGLKIKLPNGNFANRVLPIRINDLENTDIKLCESVLGGVVRGIEFIYKSAGVNRPLTPSDYPEKNQHKTFYRDQINKVANAIKENISGLKGEPLEFESEPKKVIKITLPEDKTRNKTKKVLIYSLSLLVILAVVFVTIKTNFLNKEIEKSIAVLPFRNDSPEDSTQYFMDGVMEELLTNLQSIKDLRVISRKSVEKYRNQTKSIPEIAKELGVNYIVEGSGQKSGNSLRMRIQLIKAKKEKHIWAKPFDQEKITAIDYFKIQSQVAESIAAELNAVLTPIEKQLINSIPTERLDAYELYLKGQFYWKKLTSEDLDIAMHYFEMAKEKDPGYALAYAGLSEVWVGRMQAGYSSPDEAGPKAFEAITKALEIDSTLADVHYTLALITTWGMWDWKAGENEFRKSIEFNPNHAEAHLYYAQLLLILGRSEEAKAIMEKGVKLDPFNPLVLAIYSMNLIMLHRNNEAIAAAQDALRIDPNSAPAQGMLGDALMETGRYKEGIESYKSLFKLVGYEEILPAFDAGYVKAGYKGACLQAAEALLEISKTKFVLPNWIFNLYVWTDQKEKALDWLEKMFEIHDPNLPYITAYPLFNRYRNESRYIEIVKKMNLSINEVIQ